LPSGFGICHLPRAERQNAMTGHSVIASEAKQSDFSPSVIPSRTCSAKESLACNSILPAWRLPRPFGARNDGIGVSLRSAPFICHCERQRSNLMRQIATLPSDSSMFLVPSSAFGSCQGSSQFSEPRTNNPELRTNFTLTSTLSFFRGESGLSVYKNTLNAIWK